MLRLIGLLTALLALAGQAQAQQAMPADQPGDAYALELQIRTESRSTDGSSSTSNSGGALVERVVALHPEGLELEFDLPADATADDRAREWQWPVRVLWSATVPPRLLNASEVEERLDVWLQVGEIPREACGRWFFSWTAFKIECDPNTVLETLTAYDLRSLPESTTFNLVSTTGASTVFGREIDPEEVRKEKAEADTVVAEITGAAPLTFEEALAARASEQISGVETLTRETDAEGRSIRQVRTFRWKVETADGAVEESTTTQTLTRTPIHAPR